MKPSAIAISVLTIALIASNIYWFLQVLDFGVRRTYQEAEYQANSIALKEALAILPVAADPASSKEAVIRAGATVHKVHSPEEKDGFVQLYGIRLKFNAQGRLTEAHDNLKGGREFFPRVTKQ